MRDISIEGYIKWGWWWCGLHQVESSHWWWAWVHMDDYDDEGDDDYDDYDYVDDAESNESNEGYGWLWLWEMYFWFLGFFLCILIAFIQEKPSICSF